MIEKFFDKIYDYTRHQTLFVAVIVQAISDYYSVNKNKNLNNKTSKKINLGRVKNSLRAKHWFKTEDCKYICNLAGIDYNYLINFLNTNETINDRLLGKFKI